MLSLSMYTLASLTGIIGGNKEKARSPPESSSVERASSSSGLGSTVMSCSSHNSRTHWAVCWGSVFVAPNAPTKAGSVMPISALSNRLRQSAHRCRSVRP